jgi:hypothetical protein
MSSSGCGAGGVGFDCTMRGGSAVTGWLTGAGVLGEGSWAGGGGAKACERVLGTLETAEDAGACEGASGTATGLSEVGGGELLMDLDEERGRCFGGAVASLALRWIVGFRAIFARLMQADRASRNWS